VVAIGGITAENAPELAGSGIAGIAVVSAIFAQDDIPGAVQHLKESIEKSNLKRA
jgi:thiamine-phosphate pyrophosphorylase